MPATILPFERRDVPRSPTADAESPPPTLRAFRPLSQPTSRLSARETAHRWAMLSYLRRHSVSWRRIEAPSGGKSPDPVR
jgi:hypothetical protein